MAARERALASHGNLPIRPYHLAIMPPVNILKFSTSSPADTSPLTLLKKAGYDPSQILGVVGKTEGNGCVNDFSRTLSAQVWEPLIPSSAVTIFSGGTEGVLSPHVSFILHESRPTGLVAAVGRTRELLPDEIGTEEHTTAVSQTIGLMLAGEGINEADVKLILIKCPLLTSTKIEAIKAKGKRPITTDTYESMAKSRYASAIGISLALGEVRAGAVASALNENKHWSSRASCSSGAELEDCHILLLACAPPSSAISGKKLKALSSYMEDAIDASAILDMLKEIKQDNGEVRQVFVKAEADPEGSIRSMRHTMNTDSDIHSTRHARAAVGGLVAGLTGDTAIYVSGGAEGQGPSGGGSLCMIYESGS